MKSPEERLQEASERIDFYYDTHDHACESCMEDVLQDLHIILNHDDDNIIDATLIRPETKGN